MYFVRTAGCFFKDLNWRSISMLFFGLLLGMEGVAASARADADGRASDDPELGEGGCSAGAELGRCSSGLNGSAGVATGSTGLLGDALAGAFSLSLPFTRGAMPSFDSSSSFSFSACALFCESSKGSRCFTSSRAP